MPTTTGPLLIVTDLDATLLDHGTYTAAPAREALAALEARSIPLVIASSKTRSEIDAIVRDLGGCPILIVENGGAVVLPAARAGESGGPASGEPEVIELGVARDRLVRALADINRETGAGLRGFADMSTVEIARLTGLAADAAGRAAARRYDEPFLMTREERGVDVARAAARRGLRVTRGGRFHHLTGPSDKGTAFEVVLARFADEGRRFTTVGLGDAPNDLPFLRRVDRPIVMPGPDGRLDADVAAALPHVERAPEPGPCGWNRSVLTVLAGGRLPPVDGAVA